MIGAGALSRSPSAIAGGSVALLLALAALLAPWLAAQDPFDAASLDVMSAFIPPAWLEGGDPAFLLGTDDQGRDVLSAILHGLRLSLLVGAAAVTLSATLGTMLGLLAGYRQGVVGAAIMRLADIQLSFPGLLLALLIDGVARSLLSPERQDVLALWTLVLAIGLADWPKFARLAGTACAVQKQRDYVAAARLLGVRPRLIMARHILPNIAGPLLVVAAMGLPQAVIAEATLSFLGVGLPPTQPSLGTLIRIGHDYLLSGEWWIMTFPALTLVLLTLAINLLGDSLRDTLDPTLR